MIIYHNNFTEPYFNLASEQYLMESCGTDEEIFVLWRNEPSVIIGKNQNAYAEINSDFVNEKSIKVVRRLTGGGAVFHDLGNVNFTFIVPKSEKPEIDFARFTKPIIDALAKLGIKAELSGRNDILIDGMKVSGNAQCVYNGKTMHHGTLLFNSDIGYLAGALNVNRAKMESKGIKSVRSRVTNIAEHLKEPLDVVEFKNFIEESVSADRGAEVRSFSKEDISAIQKLADEKYSSWEWVYGQSKQYSFTESRRFDFGTVELNCNIAGGIVQEISIKGDFFGTADVSELENRFLGLKFDSKEIILQLHDVHRFILGSTPSEILSLFLGNIAH